MEWSLMEISPDMLNKLMGKLGVGESFRFVDVVDLKGEHLMALPKPCCAMLLCFPFTQQHESYRSKQADKIGGNNEVYFLKQTEGSPCATIGLLHVVANNKDKLTFDNVSILKKFLDETASMSPDDRAQKFYKNKEIWAAHNEAAMQGQSRANPDKSVHLIALVNVNGHLYEFDGKLNGPVSHGATTADSFTNDAAKICREFMEREHGEYCFSVLAFCQS